MTPVGYVHRDQQGFTLVEFLVAMAVLGLVLAAVFSIFKTGTTIGLTGENKAEAQQGARAAALMEEDLRLAGYGFPPAPQTAFTNASPTLITFWADVASPPASTTLTATVNAGATVLNVVGNPGGISIGNTIYLINWNQWETLTVTNIGATTITVAKGPLASYPGGTQVGRPRLITYSWNQVTQTLSKDAGAGGGPQPLATGIQAFQLTYFDTSDLQILPANLLANLANIRRIAITLTAQSAAALNRGTFTINSTVRPRNL